MTPEESKKQSDLDQAGAFLGDHLPALWSRMFKGLIAQGFTGEQSMTILTTYIMSTSNVK